MSKIPISNIFIFSDKYQLYFLEFRCFFLFYSILLMLFYMFKVFVFNL